MTAAADNAVADADAVCSNLPLGCSGCDQHGAGGGTDLAHFFVAAGNGVAAAGALHTKARIGIAGGVCRSSLDHNLAPVGIQLFGNEGGDTGENALADLCVAADDGDDAVIAQAQEVARDKLRAGGLEVVARAGGEQRAGHNGQAEAGAGLEQRAAGGVGQCVSFDDADLRSVVHVLFLQARAAEARLIAARMRT